MKEGVWAYYIDIHHSSWGEEDQEEGMEQNGYGPLYLFDFVVVPDSNNVPMSNWCALLSYRVKTNILDTLAADQTESLDFRQKARQIVDVCKQSSIVEFIWVVWREENDYSQYRTGYYDSKGSYNLP